VGVTPVNRNILTLQRISAMLRLFHGPEHDRVRAGGGERRIDRRDRGSAIGQPSPPRCRTASAALARKINEEQADFISDHPRRFGGLALLPLPSIDHALQELEYALDTLKADGIGLLSSYDGKYLGDASFAPVFAELNRRKAIVYTHPSTSVCCSAVQPGLPPQAIEYPFETTRTISSLLINGTIANNPDIRWIFSHGGGATPMLAGRMVETVGRHANAKKFFPDGVLAELRKLYYDTASADTPPSMAALRAMAPLSHIMFGTDYPFVKPAMGVEHLGEDSLSDADREAIDRLNALALLPRLKT